MQSNTAKLTGAVLQRVVAIVPQMAFCYARRLSAVFIRRKSSGYGLDSSAIAGS